MESGMEAGIDLLFEGGDDDVSLAGQSNCPVERFFVHSQVNQIHGVSSWANG